MTEITAKILSALDGLADSPSLTLDLDGLLYPPEIVAHMKNLEGPWHLHLSSNGTGCRLLATLPSVDEEERRAVFAALLEHLLALALNHHCAGGVR